MPPSTPPRNDQLAENWLENKWLASTRTRFSKITKVALKWWPAVSHTYCFAGVEAENLYKVTYGSNGELRNTLHDIYVEYGPVDLQVRGRDADGNYYLSQMLAGHRYGPAKAGIWVSPAKVEEDRTAAAMIEPWRVVVDREDREEVVSDEAEQEDDWVKVGRMEMSEKFGRYIMENCRIAEVLF